MFDIPMNLHCSQTPITLISMMSRFDIPMNLHCSQTHCRAKELIQKFDIPMNLHCSQTSNHLRIQFAYRQRNS